MSLATSDPEAMQQLQAVAPFVAFNNQDVTGKRLVYLESGASENKSAAALSRGNCAPPQALVQPAECRECHHGVAFLQLMLVARTNACTQHRSLFN